MTTVEEVNSDKTKIPYEFVFRGVLLDCFNLLPNSMSKLILCRCKLKLSNKIIRLQTNTELGSCFYVFVSCSLLFSSELYDFVSGIIRQYSPSLRRIIVKYKHDFNRSAPVLSLDCFLNTYTALSTSHESLIQIYLHSLKFIKYFIELLLIIFSGYQVM